MPMLAAVALGVAVTMGPPPSKIPTDNPVTTLYGNGSYPWTATINWTNVVNVHDHGGDLTKAQAALVTAGGGVLYLPAGKYALKENFMLASNVVLRGVPTSGAAKKGSEPGSLQPTSVLSCPDRKHMGVLNLNGTNLGLVNLQLDGCAVMLWPLLGPQPQWSIKSYWYEATTVKAMGSNKLVLGCVVQNVNLDSSNPGTATDGWPWAFSTAVAVYSDENALVANNLLPKATATATMKLSSGQSVPYPYDNRYGIDVNKVLLGGAFGKLVPGASPGHCTDVKTFPWSFRRGLVIRDNYVYGNGRVGVSFSGGGDGKTVGSGTQVVGNHVEHSKDGVFYGFSPDHAPHGSDTNENRGYDQAGVENNVTLNTGHIYRQKLYNQPYETVDGEGILVQCTNGNNQYRNLWDRNDLSGGGSGYIAYYGVDVVDDCVISNNKVNSDQQIGLMNAKGTHPKQLVCKGNSPKAVCTASAAHATDESRSPPRSLVGADPACGNPAAGGGVFHVTNPGLNSVQLLLCSNFNNKTGQCASSAVTPCSAEGISLIRPNVSSQKYYNVSTATTQAFAFAFWATEPLSYHPLQSAPQTVWQAVPPHSEPEITVVYPGSPTRGVLCDSDADCPDTTCSKVCGPPKPPPPPPPPFPPVKVPSAADCDLAGAWKQKKTEINITKRGGGTFDFSCAAHAGNGCIGGTPEATGVITASTTDSGLSFKLLNGTTFKGLVNSTYTCLLLTVLDGAPGVKAPEWTKQLIVAPPAFDLRVASASYLGTVAEPFVPVGGEMAGGDLALIAGNGPHLFGLTPVAVLGANANANASILLLDLTATPPQPKALYRLGGRVDHLSVAGQNVAVAGDFGVALLGLSATTRDATAAVTTTWHDPLSRAEPGSCGLCCDRQGGRCRTAVGADGTVAVVLPAYGGEMAVATYDPSGHRLGSRSHRGGTVTDVEVIDTAVGLSKTVITTGFFDSSTGHEPMVMPLMRATDYTLTKEVFRGWPWGSGHPYRAPGPCDGDVADSRAEAVKLSKTPGQLLFLGRSDGGNGVFGCQTDDVLQKAPLLGSDSWSEPFNMQAQAISYLGRLKSATGQIVDGTLNLARLPDGVRGGNTLHTVDVAEDSAGNLWYAQTSACCIQNMANLTVQGQPLLTAGDGLALEVMAGNLSTCLLWHHFAKADQPQHGSSDAVAVTVGESVALLVGTSSQMMVEVNAVKGSSGPAGTAATPGLGYIVVVPLSAVAP